MSTGICSTEAEEALVVPNLYQLQGGPVHVTYTTTSVDWKPHFSYQDPQQTLLVKGDDIHTLKTDVGLLVTVTLRRSADSGWTSFSLLLPAVNLYQGHSANISTVGITTVHRFCEVPAFNRGQTHLYQILSLSGTAQLVYF